MLENYSEVYEKLNRDYFLITLMYTNTDIQHFINIRFKRYVDKIIHFGTAVAYIDNYFIERIKC